MKSKNIVVLFLSFFFMFNTGLAQQQLTYPDLIKRLYDFEYLATPPHVGEASGNFSSATILVPRK